MAHGDTRWHTQYSWFLPFSPDTQNYLVKLKILEIKSKIHTYVRKYFIYTFITNDIHENNCKYSFSASFGHNRRQSCPSSQLMAPPLISSLSTGSAESSAHRPTAWSTMATTLLHTTSQQVTPTPPETHEKSFTQQPRYKDTSTFETQLNVLIKDTLYLYYGEHQFRPF